MITSHACLIECDRPASESAIQLQRNSSGCYYEMLEKARIITCRSLLPKLFLICLVLLEFFNEWPNLMIKSGLIYSSVKYVLKTLK